MVNTLIYIAIFTFQLGLKAFGDWWYKKNKKKIINHGISSAIDVAIYIVAGYFFIVVVFEPVSVWFGIGVLVTTLSARWILYDLVYNVINKHKWNHYGISSWLDRRMNDAGKFHFVIKLIALLIGLNLIAWG